MNWSSKWSNDLVQAASEMLKQPNDISRIDPSLETVKLFQEDLQYERCTIEVKHNNKKRIVEVTIVGDLGLDFDDDGWNIYHLPTLACFDMAVPECDKTPYDKQPLLNWMAKVQQQYPTAWQMLACLTPDNYLEQRTSAKDIIQKWCLSVKVE